MKYLALGDSISIDDYTGIADGGAVRQFAKLIGATEIQDLALDGATTSSVLQTMSLIKIRPDIVTITAGGNDLLQYSGVPEEVEVSQQAYLEDVAAGIVGNLVKIGSRLSALDCPVIMNTVYDPTDGDDSLAGELGMDAAWRFVFDQINSGIRSITTEHGFLLCDLERLFHGHGIPSQEPWLVMQVEPNHAGATAIAGEWHKIARAGVRHPTP